MKYLSNFKFSFLNLLIGKHKPLKIFTMARMHRYEIPPWTWKIPVSELYLPLKMADNPFSGGSFDYEKTVVH